MAEIAKATDWQKHSIRGFISGNLMKKHDLPVESFKNEAGERTYRIAIGARAGRPPAARLAAYAPSLTGPLQVWFPFKRNPPILTAAKSRHATDHNGQQPV